MKSGKAKILIPIIVILAIIAICAVGGYLYVKHLYNRMTYKPLDEEDLGIDIVEVEKKKVNIEDYTRFVIFGSDSRDTDNEYAGRSDSIMIITINNVDKNISIISIPRDTYVDVPGYGMTKINHAFAYGQEQLSLKTINTNFGTDLTQYITIDFYGLTYTIDRVGGVEVYLDDAEIEYINNRVKAENKIYGGAGNYLLNGTQALIHSRNRYVGNDFNRASRQRQILIALVNKVINREEKDILTLVDDLLGNVTTNMDINKYKEMFTEVAQYRKEYVKDIKSVQIPSTDYGWDSMIDGIYYFSFDRDQAIKDFNKYYYNIDETVPETEETVEETSEQ